MKNITVVNFNGVKYSGVWNEKTYKSNVEGHPEYLRIYVDNEVCHITPSEYEKLGGNIQLEEHKRIVENYKSQTEYKLRKLVELLDDPAVSFLSTEIRGGCKTQWHAYFSPMPIDGLRQTFQLQR